MSDLVKPSTSIDRALRVFEDHEGDCGVSVKLSDLRALQAERDRRKEMMLTLFNACAGASTIIAHGVDDGDINERVVHLFEDALEELNAACASARAALGETT